MFPPNEWDHVPSLSKKCIRCGFRSSDHYTSCYQCVPEDERDRAIKAGERPHYAKLYYYPHTIQRKLFFMYEIVEESDDF